MAKITVGISNKHAHLTQEQIDVLFGKGFQLTFFRKIRQPDEFVSNEKIQVVGPKGSLKDVRVMGPARDKAQIEMTLTNARDIGVHAAIRVSADVEKTDGVKLIGPKGEIDLKEGVIASVRHLHMTPEEAVLLGVTDRQMVRIETTGERGLIFKNVIVRIDPFYSLEFHIDTDEANGAGLNPGDEVSLV